MSNKRTPKEAIDAAYKLAASSYVMAKAIGCSQAMAHKMIAKGSCTPKYAIPLEAAYGISRHELCPDIYPEELIEP